LKIGLCGRAQGACSQKVEQSLTRHSVAVAAHSLPGKNPADEVIILSVPAGWTAVAEAPRNYLRMRGHQRGLASRGPLSLRAMILPPGKTFNLDRNPGQFIANSTSYGNSGSGTDLSSANPGH
jgi:hypothetical protein